MTDQELVDYELLHFWIVHAHPGASTPSSQQP